MLQAGRVAVVGLLIAVVWLLRGQVCCLQEEHPQLAGWGRRALSCRLNQSSQSYDTARPPAKGLVGL